MERPAQRSPRSEEMEIYYKDNEDILQLIGEFEEYPLGFKKGESHAVIPEIRDQPLPREDGLEDTFDENKMAYKRPFAKEYLSDQVKRLLLLEKNSDFRWAQYMAGAMGREVHEIYREDDLQRVLLEKERMREIMRADIKRTILPMKEKQDQLLLLQTEKRVLIDEVDGIDLTNELHVMRQGRILIEGGDNFIGFVKMNQISRFVNDLIDEADADENQKDSYLLYIRENVNRNMKDDAGAVELNRMKSFFGSSTIVILYQAVNVIKMCKYFFDASSKTCIPYLQRKEFKQLLGLLPFRSKIPQDIVNDKPIPLQLDQFWLNLQGYEVIYIPYLSRWYDDDRITMMIQKGSKEYRNEWKTSNYSEGMVNYLITRTDDGLGGHHLIRDQPEAIKKILKHHFSKVPEFFIDDKDGRTEQEEFITIVKSHFLWKYFHNSSALTLAYHISTSIIQSRSNAIGLFFELYNELMERYIYITEEYLNHFLVPIMKKEKGIGRKDLFNLSIFPESSQLLVNWNALMKGVRNYDLINEPDFRSYFIEGKSAFVAVNREDVPLVTIEEKSATLTQHPSLELHFLFDVSIQYLQKYKDYISRKLQETEKAIAETKELMAKIASERNPMNGSSPFSGHPPYTQNRQFVTKTINSGLISLKPEITHFMAVAHTKVQQYCPGLEGMPLEEYQANHANDCGLENDFACYVAAQIAKNGNIYQRSYKSKHHEKAIITNDTETMHALKYYRFSLVNGKYNTWREYVPLNVAREERKIVKSKKRLIL